VRALILAAGLGTRMRPLSDLCPKPALPVRGVPVAAALLELLARHGVREVAVNAHALPGVLKEALERHRPSGIALHWSDEERPLGTGGAVRRVADFLRESDPCLVLAGDMLLDLDLGELVARHRQRGDLATLVLRRDPRGRRFGSIGVDEEGTVARIGRDPIGRRRRCDAGEARSGVFVGVRCLASRAFDAVPDRDVFEDLRDWLAPLAGAGEAVRGECLGPDRVVWEPVGTPAEYLAASLQPPRLSTLDWDARAAALGWRVEDGDRIVGRGARLGPGVRLRRAVVWEDEVVPAGLEACGGVFAGGRFHACPPDPEPGCGAEEAR